MRHLAPSLSLLLLLAASPLHAQEDPRPAAPADTLEARQLPDFVADAVVDFFNDPRRERFQDSTRIEPGRVIATDIAVLRGPLVIGGRIEGSVVMVNGDVRFEPGGVVTGDVLVVGGEVADARAESVGGETLVYSRRLHYRQEGERIRRVAPPIPEPADTAPADTAPAAAVGWRAGADFLITSGRSYNRVEGLPITFGPRLRTGGSNPLRISALIIHRTESGFTLDADRLGYYLRAEQFIGGRRALRLGATVHSVVDPIEDWQLTDLENALATFFLHRDHRDHYEREGVSVFTTLEPGLGPLTLTADLRWERHRSLPSGSPLTLFDNAEPWRPQPLVAEGRATLVGLQAVLDTRNQTVDPATGWYLRGRVEQSLDGGLERPALHPAGEDAAAVAEPVRFGRFTSGYADLRRYNRLSPDVRLNFRLLVGGGFGGAGLPPQRQHALGGEGSLPGYPLFSIDCGARSVAGFRSPTATPDPARRAFADYGCDAAALAQVEVRGKLAFRIRLDTAALEGEDGLGFDWDVAPQWTMFVDAGRGWAGGTRSDEPLRLDFGVGAMVERIGVFLARPLSGGDGINLFVRLGPRF